MDTNICEVITMAKFNTSQIQSFKGWDIWRFIKGRKKTAVTIVAAGIGYFIIDSTSAAIAAGGLVECIWAVAEFYFRKVEI